MIEAQNQPGSVIADVSLIIVRHFDFPGAVKVSSPVGRAAVGAPEIRAFVGWAEIGVKLQQTDRISGRRALVRSGVSVGNEHTSVVGTARVFVDGDTARLPNIIVEIIGVRNLGPILVTGRRRSNTHLVGTGSNIRAVIIGTVPNHDVGAEQRSGAGVCKADSANKIGTAFDVDVEAKRRRLIQNIGDFDVRSGELVHVSEAAIEADIRRIDICAGSARRKHEQGNRYKRNAESGTTKFKTGGKTGWKELFHQQHRISIAHQQP